MSKHVAIWMGHNESHIFDIDAARVDAKRFFHEVARSLEGSGEVLLVAPSTAKVELLRNIEKHDPVTRAKLAQAGIGG